jgi:LysM repeat protein
MEFQRDLERPEIMDDMSDELDETTRGERPRRRFRNGSGLDPQKKSLILGAAGALLLIILLVVFFGGGGGDKKAAKELDAVKSRLDGLEKRLARVEGIEQKISSSDTQVKGLQASVSRLEGLTRSMKEQMEKPAPPAPPKPQAQAAAPQKKPAAVEKRLHEVRRGETIYGIAKKYAISSDELLRLNHLSKRDPIQPGQKLIIDTGK